MSSMFEKKDSFCMFSCLLIASSLYVLYFALVGVPVFLISDNRFGGISSLRVLTDKNRSISNGISNISTRQDRYVVTSAVGRVDEQQKGRKANYVEDLIRKKFVEKNNSQAETTKASDDRSGDHVKVSASVVQVGFFEGGRSSWIYTHIFQPPISPRTCECTSNEVPHQAVVTLEKDASRAGRYELLFLPHDVGVSRISNNVWNTILSTAPPHQRRVYATFEGAYKLRHLATGLGVPYRRKAFHWSLTHHSKSDFAQPYGYFKPFPMPKLSAKENWAKDKNGLIAWMSTWSRTSWKREDFVHSLQKHISVHLYGQKYRDCPRNSNLCQEKIRGYKFYLALENSCCGEYISEKFWRTLSWDIVPVVLGAPREEYERLAPPHSFIHIDDFSSMTELAKYLHLLDKNDSLYNQYFRWKETGEVHLNYPPIHKEIVTNRTPPDGFFYSCSSVCRVTEKYLATEKGDSLKADNQQNSTNATYFDPNVDWWCGSCGVCGKHKWVRDFQKK